MDKRSPRAKTINHFLIYIFLISAFLAVSLLRIQISEKNRLNDFSFGTTVSEKGIIGEPAIKSGGYQFILDTGKGVNILVSSGAYPKLKYGDEVTITGMLEIPQNFTTDYGTEFDYVSYLYKDDILYKMSHAKVAINSSGNGNWFITHLILFKNKILESFKNILPTDEANLLGGLVLGSKSNISSQFRDALVATGTIHIIALSGYNVTIVANTLRKALSFIPAISSMWGNFLGAFAIIIFVLMTGVQSSAIRAGIMALIAIFARTSGRNYDAVRALLFAAFFMILWDPKYLIYDVSFQLSFLATFGIIFITPILSQKFSSANWRIPEKIFKVIPIRETISTTLGAQISVLPFILYKMGTLSLIALPANMLVLPIIPMTMGFGALAGFLGMISIKLAFPFAYVTHLLLQYLIWIINTCANIPFSSVVIHNFPVWLCVFLYIVMGIVVYWMTSPEK